MDISKRSGSSASTSKPQSHAQIAQGHTPGPWIAAAPDMLTALNRLLNDSMFKDHPEASQMAIDAIAKAEGRS